MSVAGMRPACGRRMSMTGRKVHRRRALPPEISYYSGICCIMHTGS
jgi:hypothetical protein